MLLSLFLAAFVVSTFSASVSELDVSAFTAVLNDADADHLILFTKTSKCASVMDALALRLSDASTRLYTYDVIRNGGWPSGLHVHNGGDSECDLILFPAGGREPAVYNFAHDPLSTAHAESQHQHPRDDDGDDAHHPHDDDGEHKHATRPSVVGSLRWLKTASSFPATVPGLSLSEIWEGREEELFQAVASGASVIRERMANLKETVARLEAENRQLRDACKNVGVKNDL